MPADYLEGHNLGKYRVLEPLGRGGMARVYRAYHPQLDRYVAVKVLRSDLVEEQEFLARFQREARAVAALRHPNVVQVFDFDAQDGNYYMVMELLEGDSLRTRLNEYRARRKRMPLDELTRILLDVLAGLDYAHSEGMIHRDVKPANILLSRRGQAVLTDFGIAQIVGGTRYTVSGALMGTLNYMAPEQGLEGQCDVRSDIYSLGIVFYEMLMGDPPYDAETPLAILMKHVNDPLPVPRKRDPSIPKPFERVVLKTLSKRPQQRYQSAEEMAEALREAARKAKVKVPERVPLPFSFATAEAPSDSVAVLSGTARAQVLDAEFAAEDTDAALGQRLAAEAAAQAIAYPDPDGAAFAQQVDASEVPEPQSAPRAGRRKAAVAQVKSRVSSQNRSVWRAVLKAIGVVAIGNFVLVMFALLSGWWGIFHRGWPFEFLLVGLGLSIIMETTGSVWLLIPTGIILGNGYIFAYYALTGFWGHWAFFWPLEPLLIGVTIWYTLRLADREDGPDRVRRLSRVFALPTYVLLGIVVVVGAIVG